MPSPGFATFRCRGAAVAPLVPLVLIGLWSAKPAVASMCTEDNLPPIQLAQAASPSQGLTPQLATHVAPALGLKFDPLLNLEPPQTGQTPVYVFGRRITGQMEDVMQSEGDAEFRKLGLFIKGDSIRHDMVRDELFAEGSVKLFREGEFYEGPKLRLKLGTTQGFFDQVSYQLTTTGGRGTADRAEFIQPLETKLTNAIFTTCPRDRPAWEIRMSEMLVDQIREVGETKSSRLYWGGVPILPLGDASLPIGDRRKSGLLPATYAATSRLGFELTVPYYWNIAPQHDMTFYPRLITRRGTQLGTELRFLRPDSLGTLFYETLPNDRVAKENRSFGSVVATARVNPQLSFGINAARASDDRYFSDFGTSLLGASQRVLPATVSMNSALKGWNIAAVAQEYQLLQDPASPLIRPYSSLPRVTASRAHRAAIGRDTFPIDWSVGTEVTSFKHPTLAEGDRFVATGAAAYRQFYQGFYITPKVSVHATHYSQQRDGSRAQTISKYLTGKPDSFDQSIYVRNVSDTGAPTPSYSRVLPTFGLEASTILERSLKVANLPMEQTLEPKISYIYTPYKDQSRYPVFDTSSPSLNFAQIFSDVAFNGPDRVADLNQMTAGLTTRFIEDQSGEERLRAALGQRFYFDTQQVVLPGGTARTDRRSDLLGQVAARLTKAWTIDAQTQYTVSKSLIQNGAIVSRYNPKPANAVSLAYRFVRESSHTADLAFQWPISRYWYAVGRYQHALRNLGGNRVNENPGLVEALAGFEYDGGCWVGRIVAQRFVTSASEKNTALFFQIELNGMGRIGTNPLSALTRSIPNYQVINQITPLPAKFDNFQ